MKKTIICFVTLILILSCNDSKKGSLTVNGTIEGLKKGTLYLQKYKDTAIVSVDSILLNGDSNFVLIDEIESPEIYYIALDKILEEKISFFAEKGVINVTTKLAKFSTSAIITGSKNNDILAEHKAMTRQFNGKKLDLVKEKFEAQRINDTALISKIERNEDNLLKRRYLYTTNFAVNHADSEVAPYLAITELYYANIKLLDTINNSLPKKIKTSKYGLELERFIKSIKNNSVD